MDNKVEAYAREAARAAQFPLGLKGRRIRAHRQKEVFNWSLGEGNGKWEVLPRPWEAIVLEVTLDPKNCLLLLMLDDGRVIAFKFEFVDSLIEVIG